MASTVAKTAETTVVTAVEGGRSELTSVGTQSKRGVNNMATEPQVERTGWTGWAVFASFMLGLAGTFQILGGIVALIRGDEYFGDKQNVAVNIDYTGWGW